MKTRLFLFINLFIVLTLVIPLGLLPTSAWQAPLAEDVAPQAALLPPEPPQAGETTYTISGTVTDSGGGPAPGVVIQASPLSGPALLVTPDTIPADGTTTATVTLANAPVGHQVRLISSRGPVDTFAAAVGQVNGSGQYTTTIHSNSGGAAVITAQDLTTGQSFATSAQVTFTGGGSPGGTGDIIITDVSGDCGRIDCPTDGFFMLGLSGLTLPLQVDVDWKGSAPGVVDFVINGKKQTVSANGASVRFDLDINQYLQEGNNVLQIQARSGNKTSVPYSLSLFGYRLPQWIMDGVNGLPAIGDQTLVLEIAFPGQPLSKQNPIDWGFPGGLNHFQWQTNIKMTLPTRGGAFEVEMSRERDHAATGRKPKAFLKLIGHEFDLSYSGRLSGVLDANAPYVVVQELEIGGSISTEFSKDFGVVDSLNALPPFGPVAAGALNAVPPIRDWLNDRAKLYVKITPKLSGKFTLAFQPQFQIANVQMGVDFPLEIGAQADLWVVQGKIYGGLGGKGTFGYSADDLRIASLQAYGFGGYQFRAGWFSIDDRGEWKLVEYPPDSGQMALQFRSTAATPPAWQLIGHNDSPDYAAFAAQPGKAQAFAPAAFGPQPAGVAAATTVTSTLVSNVYTYTEPSLAVNTVTDNALMLWVHDDPAKPVGQAQEINYSRWNGSAWSTPAGVTNDNLLDGAPQVVWPAGGSGIAVWERLNDTLPITATWNITNAKKIEIVTSTFNPTTNSWSPVTLLTNNAALDVKPQLAQNGSGGVLAVWRQNDDGQLGGDADHPDKVMAAFYNGGWGAPMTAVGNIPGLVDLGVGYGSGEATLAYTRYLTPTGSVTPTLQLFTSRWNGTAWAPPVQRTDDSLGHHNPQAAYDSANQPLLVWQAGAELRLQNLTTSATANLSLPAAMGAIDQFRLVQDGGGNLAAIFTAQGGQRDLYLSVYDQSHNLWGAPRLFTNNRAAESYPAPGLDSTGRLLMGYAVTAVSSITRTTTISGTSQVVTFTMPVDGQTDLMTLAHTFDRNLTLTNAGLAVSDDHPTPGGSVIISATLQNSGDWALDGAAVSFYAGDPNNGGSLIGTTSLSGALAAGYTATLCL